MKTVSLEALNAALSVVGWHAEFVSAAPKDFTVALYKPQGGQALNRFQFDPLDPADNGPWDDLGALHWFPIEDAGVEREIYALCKACAE